MPKVVEASTSAASRKPSATSDRLRLAVRRGLLLILVAVVSFLHLSASAQRTPHHGDEAGWVAAAHYYTALVSHGDSDPQHWEPDEHGYFGMLNPPLGKWWLGVPLVLRYGADKAPFQDRFNWDQSVDWNVSAGAFEPRDVVMTARRAAVLAGVACCLTLFLVACACAGDGAGLLAVALTLVNPLFSRYSTRAMTDAPYALFLLLCGLAVVWLLRARPERVVPWCAVTGLLAGLAGCVKVTGVVIGLLTLGAGLLLYCSVQRASWKRCALGAVTAGAIGFLVMVALNPYVSPVVVDRIYSLLPEATDRIDRRDAYAHWQVQHTSQRVLFRPNAPLRLWKIAKGWSALIDRQAAEAKNGWGEWEGNRLRTFHYALLRWASPPNMTRAGLALPVSVVGLALLTLYHLRSRKLHPAMGALAVFLVHYLFLLALQKLNWDRYYLPTVLAGQAAVAVFAAWVLERAWSWVQSQRVGKQDGDPVPVTA